MVATVGFGVRIFGCDPFGSSSDLRLKPVCSFGVDQRMNKDIWMVAAFGHAICVFAC